jgi:hypothetical protein
VEQAGLSGTFPLPELATERGGLYLDTKNLFSTNERDTKSAFEGGIGYQYGLSKTWYSPVMIEQEVQGNQVATNLSTVSSLSVTTELPWAWAASGTRDWYVRLPRSPSFALNFPYTHRFNQVVSGSAKPLPVDDFALNPALAFDGGQILKRLCKSVPAPGDGKSSVDKGLIDKGLCLNWEADLGLWYLPLEDTSKGSQRAEGSWDYSFLVPLSNFAHIPYVKEDTQSAQMQIRIKYEDSISPANNYARSKKWVFGVEMMKK